MKKNLAALLLVLLAFAGCLEFDAQEVTIRYDEAADRIDIHVVYRGFIAEGRNDGRNDPLDKALADLAAARASGEVAFWCNWPVSFDLTREYVPPVKALLAHVDVENGNLFTDMQGVLCGEQFVRIRDAKAFLKKVNTALDLLVQTQLAGGTSGHGGTHAWDADTKDLVREFQRGGEKLVVVEPGRIELRLPLSAKDHAWFKNQVEQLFLDNMPREIVRHIGIAERRANGGDPADTYVANEAVAVPGALLRSEIARAPSFRFFWDNELCFVREPELTRVSFGVRTNKDLLIKKASEGFSHPALLEKLRANGEKIEDGIPDQELVRRFDAFCKRDAVLPAKVVELRSGGEKGKGEKKDGAGK